MASLFRKEKFPKTSKQTLAHTSLTKMVPWGAIKKEVGSGYWVCNCAAVFSPRSTLQPSPSLLPWTLTCMDCILEFLGFWLSVWFSQWEPGRRLEEMKKGGQGIFPQLSPWRKTWPVLLTKDHNFSKMVLYINFFSRSRWPFSSPSLRLMEF